MTPFRVFIVDDSAVVRAVISTMLSSDPEITIAGFAANGFQTMDRLPEARPDLVTLDIEMPGMNGLETLVEIRKIYPKLPVIMFSSLTERGATATLDALARGASDYVTKPSGGTSARTQERLREDLLRKIKSLCAARTLLPSRTSLPLSPPQPRLVAGEQPPRVDVVAIGASIGGPCALTALLQQIPPDFPVPIVVVQHMPPVFTRLFAERLHGLGRLKVHEGRDGVRIFPGQLWIAPGDWHMTVARVGGEVVLALNQGAQENSCRPAVDVLFRSVAVSYKANVLAIVLTGMGADGTLGCASIREAGGQVIVQDEESSVVWGMPGSVVAAQVAADVYPLHRIAAEMVRRVSAQSALAHAAQA